MNIKFWSEDFKDRDLCSLVFSLHPWILKFKKSVSNSDSTNSNSFTKKKLLNETIVVDFENNRESTKIPRGKLHFFSIFQLLLGSRQPFFGILTDERQPVQFPCTLIISRVSDVTGNARLFPVNTHYIASGYSISVLFIMFDIFLSHSSYL